MELVVIRWDGERLAFAKRLNLACDRAGIPAKGSGRQKVLGELFGVSQNGARKWLEGEAIPNTKRLPAMARMLGVTTEWLLTLDESDPPQTGGLPVGEEPNTYDLEDLRVARAIRSLPPKSRVALQTIFDSLVKSAPWDEVTERRGGGKKP